MVSRICHPKPSPGPHGASVLVGPYMTGSRLLRTRQPLCGSGRFSSPPHTTPRPRDRTMCGIGPQLLLLLYTPAHSPGTPWPYPGDGLGWFDTTPQKRGGGQTRVDPRQISSPCYHVPDPPAAHRCTQVGGLLFERMSAMPSSKSPASGSAECAVVAGEGRSGSGSGLASGLGSGSESGSRLGSGWTSGLESGVWV